MSLDARTHEEQLTPQERRAMLRAFADRMLLRVTRMDDPEDLPGVERAARVAAVIERLYSRCDRAEKHAPDPRKLEGERARHTVEAIKARTTLASTLEWGERRREALGKWWDVAGAETQAETQVQARVKAPARVSPPATPRAAPEEAPVSQPLSQPAPKPNPVLEPDVTPRPATLPGLTPQAPEGDYIDYTDVILKARAELGLRDIATSAFMEPVQAPPPPQAAFSGCGPPCKLGVV